MRYILIMLLAGLFSCGPRFSTEAELESKLMETMQEHLRLSARQGVTFTVKEVIWAEKSKDYFCEFRVRMQDGSKDTVGTMTALVSKDFKTVERSQ